MHSSDASSRSDVTINADQSSRKDDVGADKKEVKAGTSTVVGDAGKMRSAHRLDQDQKSGRKFFDSGEWMLSKEGKVPADSLSPDANSNLFNSLPQARYSTVRSHGSDQPRSRLGPS